MTASEIPATLTTDGAAFDRRSFAGFFRPYQQILAALI